MPDIRSGSAKNNATQRQINRVVLLESRQKSLPPDIKALCFIKQLTVDKAREILVDGFDIGATTSGTERVSNFSRRQFAANTVKKEPNKAFQDRLIVHLAAKYDVFVENRC